MKESRKEGRRWLEQAKADLEFAEYALDGDFHAHACFEAHQAAEKALKAIHYALLGKRTVLGHSTSQLAHEAGFTKVDNELLLVLDQYYIPTRYPSGLPDGIPAKAYTARQAREAVGTAREVVVAVEQSLK